MGRRINLGKWKEFRGKGRVGLLKLKVRARGDGDGGIRIKVVLKKLVVFLFRYSN